MDDLTGKKVVERINTAHPQLLRTNTHPACGEFIQRVTKEPEMVAERVGLLSKEPGENGYTFPNGIKTSHDVIAWPDGRRTDIINSAGAGPSPGGPAWQPVPQYLPDGTLNWRPKNVWIDTSAWPIFDSGTAVVPPDRSAILAFGWFCWMRAWADWEAECKENEAWILGEINPSVYRVMLCVEGLSHVSGQAPDPWRDAGVQIDNTWEDRFKKMLDHLGGQGRQAHCTVYGGRNQTPTDSDRRRFHDRIVAAAAGKWAAIKSFEMMNEFKVNRWTAEEVRNAGRDLRSKVPAAIPIALSSPDMAHGGSGTTTNEEMQASFDELYGGADHGGANLITIHTMRDGGKWSDPFAFNVYYPNLPKVNNEPPGPGTSSGGENTDAARVALDLGRTVNAGWYAYVGHAEWCPWNGHLPSEYYNGWREIKFLKDLPKMPECAKVMKKIGGVVDPPKPVIHDHLMPGDQLKPGEQLVSAGKTCQALYDKDGNFVIYTDKGEPVWASNTAGTQPGSVQMNPDGNLVLYGKEGTPLWSTQTQDHPGAMCQLNDDRNLVIYEDPTGPLAGTPLWSSQGGLVV